MGMFVNQCRNQNKHLHWLSIKAKGNKKKEGLEKVWPKRKRTLKSLQGESLDSEWSFFFIHANINLVMKFLRVLNLNGVFCEESLESLPSKINFWKDGQYHHQTKNRSAFLSSQTYTLLSLTMGKEGWLFRQKTTWKVIILVSCYVLYPRWIMRSYFAQ